MEKVKVIIMPDIHGRTFWKNAISQFPKEKYPAIKIIFLGDYLDPYESYDGITKEQAYDNFIDIINTAKNDDRIQLLIGNHDWHYFVNLDRCRIDNERKKKIEKLFIDNINMFKLVDIEEISEKKYLFTHAGITYNWLKSIINMTEVECHEWKTNDEFPIKEEDPKYQWSYRISQINKTYDFSVFNESLKHYDDKFYTYFISMIGVERGGWHTNGSLIWADVHEHLFMFNEKIGDYYQIFGHTISYPNCDPKAWYIGEDYAMLDASRAFIITNNNKIKEI